MTRLSKTKALRSSVGSRALSKPEVSIHWQADARDAAGRGVAVDCCFATSLSVGSFRNIDNAGNAEIPLADPVDSKC